MELLDLLEADITWLGTQHKQINYMTWECLIFHVLIYAMKLVASWHICWNNDYLWLMTNVILTCLNLHVDYIGTFGYLV